MPYMIKNLIIRKKVDLKKIIKLERNKSITKEELKIIKKAYRILNQEINSKKYRCEEYCFGCCQCNFSRFCEDFKSIINDFLEDFDKK